MDEDLYIKCDENMLIYDGTSTEDDLVDMEYITPIVKVQIHDKEPMEIFRCDTDGALVISTQASLRRHAGHKLKSPVLLKREELKLLVEGKLG